MAPRKNNRNPQSTLTIKQPSAATVASRGAKRRARKKATVSTANLTYSLPPYVELMINPWDSPLETSHCPDSNTRPSIVWREQEAKTLSTDPQGNFLIQFNPFIAALQSNYTLDASGVSTGAPYVGASNNTTLASTFDYVRLYAMGIEVEYVGQADLAKGVYGVATGPIAMASVGSRFSMLADERTYKEANVTNGEKLAATVRYGDLPFQAISNTTAQYDANLAYIAVGGTGLPVSTACIRIRIVFVGEYVASFTSLMQRNASYSMNHPAQLSTAQSIIGPDSETAAGRDPIGTLTKYAHKAAKLGAELNGLYEVGRDFAKIAADFAKLM